MEEEAKPLSGLEPIGTVVSSRREVEDDGWDAVRSVIRLDPAVLRPEAVAGLGEFSHIEVVYLLDRVDPGRVERGARHPRGNREWPSVGILAQRAKDRPNRLGLARCLLVSVDGLELSVRDLDAVDGTPVLDIKPWMAEFGPRGDVRQPDWSRRLMAGYWAAPEPAGPPDRTRASYDRVAGAYAAELSGELDQKPLDRALISALAEMAGPGPIIDGGGGPGQVARACLDLGRCAFDIDLSPAMCAEARSGDLTSLPLRTASVGALASFYAVIHLDRPGREAAYHEVARVLQPGGYALIAFHTRDGATGPGGAVTRTEWKGQPVDLTFRFLDPADEAAALAGAGLELVARLDRGPVGEAEYPSQRSYLLVLRPV